MRCLYFLQLTQMALKTNCPYSHKQWLLFAWKFDLNLFVFLVGLQPLIQSAISEWVSWFGVWLYKYWEAVSLHVLYKGTDQPNNSLNKDSYLILVVSSQSTKNKKVYIFLCVYIWKPGPLIPHLPAQLLCMNSLVQQFTDCRWSEKEEVDVILKHFNLVTLTLTLKPWKRDMLSTLYICVMHLFTVSQYFF